MLPLSFFFTAKVSLSILNTSLHLGNIHKDIIYWMNEWILKTIRKSIQNQRAWGQALAASSDN